MRGGVGILMKTHVIVAIDGSYQHRFIQVSDRTRTADVGRWGDGGLSNIIEICNKSATAVRIAPIEPTRNTRCTENKNDQGADTRKSQLDIIEACRACVLLETPTPW